MPVFVGSTGDVRAADVPHRVGNVTLRLLADEGPEYRARRWS
jgi:hypothetical protein